MESYRQELLGRLERREATVAVIGLGYVGLPLAVEAALAGHRVIGIDLDRRKVDAIQGGRSHIEDIDSATVANLVGRGRLSATDDFAAAAEADVAVVAVPTPIDEYRVPDLSLVARATASLAAVMKPGSIFLLESTTYPGTTEEIVVPSFTGRGAVVGADIFIGYSPERIDPGNRKWRLDNTPKVVSGMTPACLEVATAFYGTFVQRLVPVSNVKTAEITKLFENVFRLVNIALVSEFQDICEAFHIDVWEVIKACSTKPYGFTAFYPGPGPGGHCIPVDPFYLSWKAREMRVSTEFIDLASRITQDRPRQVAGQTAAALNSVRKPLNGSHVAMIGVAYKKNTADVRESPALPILRLLAAEGAIVTYHDPHVAEVRIDGEVLHSADLDHDYLAGQDCVVIVTDHDSIDWGLVRESAPLVVDTRNALAAATETAALAQAPAGPAAAVRAGGLDTASGLKILADAKEA